MAIYSNDPNIVVLPKSFHNENAFSGTATQAGSYKAIREAGIVRVFLEKVLEEFEAQEYWTKQLAQEEEEEKENKLQEVVKPVVQDKKRKLEEIPMSEQATKKKENEDQLSDLAIIYVKKLKKIQQDYNHNMAGKKISFTAEAPRYGYIDVDTLNKFADHVQTVVESEMLSPVDPFIRNPNRQTPHVADTYTQQPDHASIPEILKINLMNRNILDKNRMTVAEKIAKGDVKFLIEQRRLREAAHANIEPLRETLAEARNKLSSSEYAKVMQLANGPSAPPENNEITNRSQVPGAVTPTLSYVSPTPIPVATPIPHAVPINNAAGLPVAEAEFATAQPQSVNEQNSSDRIINIPDMYIQQCGVAPTLPFTRCTKSYIEHEIIPEVEKRTEAIDEFFNDATNELTPSMLQTMTEYIAPSAPPIQEDNLPEPSAPPVEEDEPIWKPPVPRPPMGYQKKPES